MLSAAVFGRPLDDTIAQVISATAFGTAFAALRLHIGVVWPLALLHGLGNWTQVNSPGAAPRPSVLPAPETGAAARMEA